MNERTDRLSMAGIEGFGGEDVDSTTRWKINAMLSSGSPQ